MVAHLSSIYVTQTPRMKVRFLRTINSIVAGEIISLPYLDANYWITIGVAEEVKQRPVTVQRIRKTETR
jgi:hypothetical protein